MKYGGFSGIQSSLFTVIITSPHLSDRTVTRAPEGNMTGVLDDLDVHAVFLKSRHWR